MTVLDHATGFAPDGCVPARDVLLDADVVCERLGRSLGRDGPLAIEACTLGRAKYRIGESLRVVYRLTVKGKPQLVTGRTFRGRAPAAYRKAVAGASPVVAAGGDVLNGVVLDSDLDTVWWTFPNDRRLRGLAALMGPSADVVRLTDGSPAPWVASEVAEYAPERTLTVRAIDYRGATVAYAKAYGPLTDVDTVAARYAHVAHGLRSFGGEVVSPRPLGWSQEHRVVALEAMTGTRWSELTDDRAPGALRRLGQGIAAVHDTEPPPGCAPFGRLNVDRVVNSAQLIARARPDVAGRVRALAARLADCPPPADGAVLLHGDCHPKNALIGSGGVALIDLDQSGSGAAAADIGSLLARLRHGEILGERQPPTCAAMAAAFLEGYASVRPLPSPASLRWHMAAAALAERMMRAVNRVHRPALGRLDELLAVAESELTVGSHR